MPDGGEEWGVEFGMADAGAGGGGHCGGGVEKCMMVWVTERLRAWELETRDGVRERYILCAESVLRVN